MRTGGVEPPQSVTLRLQRSELAGAQRPLGDSAGGIRTHGLELMRLARTTGLLYRASIWLAGVEPAISGAQSRWGGQSPLQPGAPVDDRGIEPRSTASSERRLPSQPVVVVCGSGGRRAKNRLEGLAVSLAQDRHAAAGSLRPRRRTPLGLCPARQGGDPAAGIHLVDSCPAERLKRRQGIAPCSTGSRPEGSLLALRRSLAGRSRTPVHHGRSVALIR